MTHATFRRQPLKNSRTGFVPARRLLSFGPENQDGRNEGQRHHDRAISDSKFNWIGQPIELQALDRKSRLRQFEIGFGPDPRTRTRAIVSSQPVAAPATRKQGVLSIAEVEFDSIANSQASDPQRCQSASHDKQHAPDLSSPTVEEVTHRDSSISVASTGSSRRREWRKTG